MNKEEAFVKSIAKELKQIRDKVYDLQMLLNHDDLNIINMHKQIKKKRRIKPLIPKQFSNAHHFKPVPQSELTLPNTINHDPKNKGSEVITPVFSNMQIANASKVNKFMISGVPIKTVSTLNTTRSINPRLPSAIQSKKKEEYNKLPYNIKRLNRNFHIANNQLIIQPLMTDIYESPIPSTLTERFHNNHNESDVVYKNFTPNKVKDYFFRKSLKLKNYKLFTSNKKNLSTLTPYDLKSDQNQSDINDIRIIHIKTKI